MEDPKKYQSTRMRSFIRFVIQKVGCRNFLCQSLKKISFSKINLLNLGKNLVGPWGSTQLGERSPKPVSHPKSDTRKVSHPSGPQNRPTCTCSTLPRASARTSPLGAAARARRSPRAEPSTGVADGPQGGEAREGDASGGCRRCE